MNQKSKLKFRKELCLVWINEFEYRFMSNFIDLSDYSYIYCC